MRKCVESICNSDYPHLEIICINDGSTDSRIIVINQPNSGVSAARNAGLDAATGEYVTGVDSDDYIAPDLYGRAAGHFTEGTDVVAFGITEEYIPPEAKPAKKMYPDEPYTGYQDITEQVILNMHAMFCPRLWRRSIIESHHIRFAHGVRFEDADFFLKSILHCKKAYFLQYRGYHYLQHAESYMGQQFSGHADLPPFWKWNAGCTPTCRKQEHGCSTGTSSPTCWSVTRPAPAIIFQHSRRRRSRKHTTGSAWNWGCRMSFPTIFPCKPSNP